MQSNLVYPTSGLSNIYEEQTWLDKRGPIVCVSAGGRDVAQESLVSQSVESQ